MKDFIWVINKGSEKFEKTDSDLKKHIILEPMIPKSLPSNIAIKYVQSYSTINICDHPEKYFTDRAYKQLIIRDAGIGDLLLLEPIIRKLGKKDNIEVSALSRYPEVYENHPLLKDNFKMKDKGAVNVDLTLFDIYDDLRSYSETCVNHDTKHRTDCYNQMFNLDLDDKEPRLYFDKKEKSIVKRKSGMIYIGIQCDASHIYRRYERGKQLIEFLLEQNKKYVLVLFGSYDYIKDIPKNKRIIDMQAKTNIRQAMNIIKELDYMIGVDSGLMHIALTLHIPTVCIMTIISPELRLSYYTGDYKVITKNIECIGCGNKHMEKCNYGDKKAHPEFTPPCLDITPAEIYGKLLELPEKNEVRVFHTQKKVVNINSGKKLVMPIIVLNEEANLPRFIENVINHPSIGRVIAIDGGSTDKTVELLESAGVEVYVHHYNKKYHDMQALQRNISFSYVPDGTKCIMMDIDECFSRELSDYLQELAESNIEYGVISRRTFDYYKDIDDPNKRIKDYPDYQPRFFTWNRHFKWAQSPHHQVYNCPKPTQINKDIIHFEKEGKDRDALEKTWSEMQIKTRKVYG